MPVSSEIWAFHCSDGDLGPELQVPPVALDGDLLLGQRQGHPAAGRLAGQPQLAHLLEQHQRLVRAAVVDRPLHAGVVELGGGPHPGPLDGDVGALAGRVDLDGPEQGRAHLVGQQGSGALGDQRRVQRHPRVGAVQRHPALVRLEVDRVARRDERREVGDRVGHDVAVAVARDVHGLVEVPRRRRVDRHEGQVGPVEVRHPRGSGCRRGRRHHVLGELGRDLELLLDARDAVPELVRRDTVVGARDVDDATGDHAVTLARSKPGSGAPLACRRC